MASNTIGNFLENVSSIIEEADQEDAYAMHRPKHPRQQSR